MRLCLCTILGLGILSFNSCSNGKIDGSKTNADSLLTKTITFPSNLTQLNGTSFQSIDSFLFNNDSKTKIVSIIDGTCAKCIINQMNKIDSTFGSILLDSDNIMVFILNVSQHDSAYFMRNLQPIINANGIILWDNNYNFERYNKLLTTDINLRTFMVNKENKIVQYGNPLMHPDAIWEYKAKLENNL
ncbi:MAG: hypothetical protein AB7S48_06745 [Bacteroidales bacterium]